jgi:hypothetical protein
MTADELLSDGCCSVTEAAKFLGCGRSMESGRLVYIKFGRRRVIPRRRWLSWQANYGTRRPLDSEARISENPKELRRTGGIQP